jgi:ankyrin repeat protein
MKAKPVGATPFLLAAVTYDAAVMRALAAGGADPLLAIQTGTTPLMMAAGSGRREDRTAEEERRALEAVQAAVELGADVHPADENGQTAMHAAAYTGSDEIIRVLAKAGAKVNVTDNYGQTPLSIAEAVIPETVLDFGLRPFIVHESTANLLLELGATPLAASSARR